MVIKNKYGHCEYSFEKDSSGDYVHIYNLFVYPKFRRQGQAKILIQMAVDSIRKTRYDREIQIVADPVDNSISKDKLISFYKSMGLKVFEYYG